MGVPKNNFSKFGFIFAPEWFVAGGQSVVSWDWTDFADCANSVQDSLTDHFSPGLTGGLRLYSPGLTVRLGMSWWCLPVGVVYQISPIPTVHGLALLMNRQNGSRFLVARPS